MGVILSVGTCPPKNPIQQKETVEFAKELFSESFSNINRLLKVFENGEIEKRHFAEPLSWYRTERSFQEKNDAYVKHAVHLSIEAIKRCLTRSDLLTRSIPYEEIDAIFFVSSTGFSTPSIDVKLLNELPFKRSIKRSPLWGLGCAGGAIGLSRAFEFCKAFPSAKALVVCVELCSLTFQHDDRSKSNLIGTSLFADGVGAVLVAGTDTDYKNDSKQVHPIQIIDTRSSLLEDSEDVMGWSIKNNGLYVIFSRDIPTIIEKWLRPNVEQFLYEHGISLNQLKHFLAHPGGKKVLLAYEKSLQLHKEQLDVSHDVLKQYGNMSSATVLYVIDRFLKNQRGEKGDYGIVAAMGPGFCAEQLLIQWGVA